MDLTELTLSELRQQLRQGSTSSVATTEAILARIDAFDGSIKAYLSVNSDQALDMAKKADERRARGEEAALLGIPVAIKDIICTRGVETTAGSRILEGFIPPYDATVVARLKRAGAVILGKTNTDEFAMGSSTENSAYAVTRNPWDQERVPGGSSGGSAAAVAAGMAYAALGSDTGGSVRQPASFCGVVGMRPTYGRVSRRGVVAFASSLDQVGPFARSVRDCAILLQVIAGHDPWDSTSIDVKVPDFEAELTGDIEGLRVGIPREYFAEGLDAQVETVVREAIEQLQALGAELVDLSLPHTRYALPAYYLIAPAEASANLARYDGVRFGPRREGADGIESVKKTRSLFGAETKRRIMLGTYALSAGYYEAYYGKALKARTLIKNDFEEAFQRVDVIAAPTSPTTAFRVGERTTDPLSMYIADVLTVPLNLSAACGISVPCGFDDEGLPVGLQLIGNTLQEAMVLNVAYTYEQATRWRRRRPMEQT